MQLSQFLAIPITSHVCTAVWAVVVVSIHPVVHFSTNRTLAAFNTYVAILAKIFLGDDKVYILGEKSMGCAEYWDIIDYALPNSGIYLHLGSENQKSFEICPKWHGETYGVYPDFWSLGKDLNETIFLVTNDEKMKEKFKNNYDARD